MTTETKDALHPESVLLSGNDPKIKRREITMSAKNNNQLNIPQAREAMDKFKMQAASDVAFSLSNNLTISST